MAKEELKEGQQEVAACQKRICLADHSEYGWATVEVYDDDELAEDPADEKKMADAEKEAARKVTRKRKAKGKDSYRGGGDYRRHPLGDQVPSTNPGSSKLPELRPRPLGPCWDCGGFGHIVTNCPQPPKWYPCESTDVYVCDDLYLCDAVHVPDLLTSDIMSSTIDTQGAVNKEDLVTKGVTDLIAGHSHLFSHHIEGVDCPRKCALAISTSK